MRKGSGPSCLVVLASLAGFRVAERLSGSSLALAMHLAGHVERLRAGGRAFRAAPPSRLDDGGWPHAA